MAKGRQPLLFYAATKIEKDQYTPVEQHSTGLVKINYSSFMKLHMIILAVHTCI